MITESMMYWITRLDNLCGVFTFIAVFGIAALVITVIAYFTNDPYDDEKVHYHRWMKRFGITAFTVLILGIFIPSSKEMAMIYAVPAITRSDVVREDLPELYDYGVKALKQQLQEWSEPRETRHAQ